MMDLLRDTPALDEKAAAGVARELFGLDAVASPLPGERDQNFLLETPSGDRFVLKIANAAEERAILDAQNEAMRYASAKTPLCPAVVTNLRGSGLAGWQTSEGRQYFVRLLTWLPGVTFGSLDRHPAALLQALGGAVGELDAALDGFDHPAIHRDFSWDLANGLAVVRQYSTLVRDDRERSLIERVAERVERDETVRFDRLPRRAAHNDPNDHNVLVRRRDGGEYDVTGILDFGDIVHTYGVADLAIATAYAILDEPDPVAAAAAVVRGYHRVRALHDDEIDAVFGLVLLRLSVSVSMAAFQQAQRPDDPYLTISQASIRRTLPRLASLDAGAVAAVFRRACGDAGSPSMTQMNETRDLLARRRAAIGGSVRLAYERPVTIVRGSMQYVFDEAGRRYLDAYNNVPHVGHCHPRVVEAAAEQMRTLNTNSRYLDEHIVELAERLTATLPDSLRVCFFVNSGSEANELALRLARVHTGHHGVIVLDAAYHGNTTTLVEISPYKFNGPGGAGAPAWVRTVPIPDVYRGSIKAAPDAGSRYAEHVEKAAVDLDKSGSGVAAFIAESAPSVGGQIILPEGYLRAAYAAVRKAGGIVIADEVQTAYGRLGNCFYAFEAQNVVPDVVVLGKPIGNGHPLGAVITTAAIARSFDNGMEYFSTFGGNTVSCAVGLAVLDVVRDEHLQAHARDVGSALLDRLRALPSKHAIVGDVRGSGLFIGVELVKDRDTLEPATSEATRVVNRLREEGILLGTDGPFANVLKIRPPMPFTIADAQTLCSTLERVLEER